MENKIKIFLADNSEDKTLEKYFYESQKFDLVGTSVVGQDVVKEVVQKKPDVLVLEIMLSGMDGFMVLSSLKKQMKENLPKVIFISSLSHSGFVSKAIKEGASYFMVKPIMPENLAERIENVLEEKSVESKEEKQLDEKISNIFISIGIPAHIKGYQFLREAVKLAVEEP